MCGPTLGRMYWGKHADADRAALEPRQRKRDRDDIMSLLHGRALRLRGKRLAETQDHSWSYKCRPGLSKEIDESHGTCAAYSVSSLSGFWSCRTRRTVKAEDAQNLCCFVVFLVNVKALPYRGRSDGSSTCCRRRAGGRSAHHELAAVEVSLFRCAVCRKLYVIHPSGMLGHPRHFAVGMVVRHLLDAAPALLDRVKCKVQALNVARKRCRVHQRSNGCPKCVLNAGGCAAA